jgi:hypothetical protein
MERRKERFSFAHCNEDESYFTATNTTSRGKAGNAIS